MRAVGVPDKTWWGRLLYVAFNDFPFPFTSFGYHYDLNHHRWHGPDTGDQYDPGP
jgi:hypothetical protein